MEDVKVKRQQRGVKLIKVPNRVTSRCTPKMALSRFPILNDDRGGHEKAFSIINIILVVKPAYQILLAWK